MMSSSRAFCKNILQDNLRKYNYVTSTVFTRDCSSINTENYNVKGKYDIIVAGGGMVGCTLACAIGKSSVLSNLKILLLEGSPKQNFTLQPEYSNRVVALNQNTKYLMKKLKIWEHIEKMRLQPVKNMQVWDACSNALITFDSVDMDDDVAYIVENDVLLHAVNRELTSSNVKNVDIVYGAKIQVCELPKSSDPQQESVVKMENGDSYSCQLLVGADGANSVVRRAMGVQYLSWSYDQMGIVATLLLAEESENTTAWQRFVPGGPVALLPLDGTRSSLVWSVPPERAQHLLGLADEQFVDELNDALWKKHEQNAGVAACMSCLVSGLRRAGLSEGESRPRRLPPSVRDIAPKSRAAFPLGFGHSTRYVSPGVALVGDAAHRVHPLAGQGVNLGFGDVKDFSHLLAENIYSGQDITHHSWLREYESSRQRHNVPTQLAIDALHRLYLGTAPPFVLLRSLGLQITNALHPLKKAIMNHATA